MTVAMIGQLQDGRKIVQVVAKMFGVIDSGTALITGGPVALTIGANAIVGITQIGTLIITLPTGYTATAATNGATVLPSPTNCVAGPNNVVISVLGAGTITVTVTQVTMPEAIEIPNLRTIDAILSVSITGGYKADVADCTIAGNKVTVNPYYYNYAAANGVAIVVPNTVDLTGQTVTLTVIGY